VSLFSVEERKCAYWAVDAHVPSNTCVALGDGPLVTLAIEHLGRQLRLGALTGVTAVACSTRAASYAALAGVPFAPEGAAPDVLLEEADRVDTESPTLAYVVGQRAEPSQPELAKAAAVRAAAKAIVVLAQREALGDLSTDGVPVCVQSENWEETAESLDDAFLGDASVWRRPALGPRSDPFGGEMAYVAPDGTTIVDLAFDDGFALDCVPATAVEVAEAIESIDGVLAHGLVPSGATCAIIVGQIGSATPQIQLPSAS
jgi:ribose 5-phosphate isomerase A